MKKRPFSLRVLYFECDVVEKSIVGNIHHAVDLRSCYFKVDAELRDVPVLDLSLKLYLKGDINELCG